MHSAPLTNCSPRRCTGGMRCDATTTAVRPCLNQPSIYIYIIIYLRWCVFVWVNEIAGDSVTAREQTLIKYNGIVIIKTTVRRCRNLLLTLSLSLSLPVYRPPPRRRPRVYSRGYCIILSYYRRPRRTRCMNRYKYTV